MMFPFSLYVMAYFLGCFFVLCWLGYTVMRHGKVSGPGVGCASLVLLPLGLWMGWAFFADDVDVNPAVESQAELVGSYVSPSESIHLHADGTFAAKGIGPASGTWRYDHNFVLTLSGTELRPRVVRCNGALCIAPWYDGGEGPLGTLLRQGE